MAIRKLLAYAAIYVLWGASFLAIRQVVAVTPPFFAASFRFLCAGFILYAYSLAKGMPQPTRRQCISTALLGLILFAGDYGCLFWAEKEVPSGLARDRGHDPGLGLAGRMVVRRFATAHGKVPGGHHPRDSRCRPADAPPDSTAAASLHRPWFCSWAASSGPAGTVASRHLQLPKQLSMSSGLQMTWGGGFLLLISAATGELGKLPALFHRWDWHVAFAMAYLILFASIIAFTAYVWLIARNPTTRVASYAYATR